VCVCEKMKSIVFVGFVLLAVCFAAPIPIISDTVVHVVIPKDSDRVVYQWTGDVDAVTHSTACYGEIDVYYSKDESITPETGKYFFTYNAEKPIHTKAGFPKHYYILFVAKDKSNSGPGGINGAVDMAVSTSVEGMNAMLPDVFDGKVGISIGSKSATLTWKATAADDIKVYRKDYAVKDYDSKKDFPPARYYQTGCSAKLWLNYDEAATNSVQYKHSEDEHTGVVTVKDTSTEKAVIVSITSEKKIANSFTNTYKYVVVGSASSTVLSMVALFCLLLSILLI